MADGDEPGRVAGGGGGSAQQLMDLNGLTYRLDPSLSVATQRVQREYQTVRDQYNPGEWLVATFGTGATYVDARNSYLEFDLSFTFTQASSEDTHKLRGANQVSLNQERYYLGLAGGTTPDSGQASSCFDTIRWVHSSGTELIREEQANRYNAIRNAFENSQDYNDTVGGMNSWLVDGLDLDLTAAGGVRAAVAAPRNYTRKVVLPLCQLTSAWSQSSLLPSFLIAGSTIELRISAIVDMFRTWRLLEYSDPQVADPGPPPVTSNVRIVPSTGRFVPGASLIPGDVPLPSGTAGPAVANVTINKPRLVCETITLTDAVQRALANLSSGRGLEYPIESQFYQRADASEKSNVSVQVTRALSRVNRMDASPRSTNIGESLGDAAAAVAAGIYTSYDTTGTWSIGNSRFDEPGDSFYVQLGAETMPIVPISHPLKQYHAALVTFGKMIDRFNPPTVSLARFKENKAIMTVPLEKSSTLSQSGVSVSAQRTANFDITFADTAAKSRDVDLFVTYVKLLTCFLDNVVVRS